MASNLKELVKNLIEEIEQEELELEEATTTSNVDGYNTPNAFKKSDGTDEDDTTEDVVDIPDWVAKRVDEFLDDLEEEYVWWT